MAKISFTALEYLSIIFWIASSRAELKELNAQIIDDDKKLARLLAKRFAAKEAFTKALGTGFRDNIFLKNKLIFYKSRCIVRIS